MHVAAMLNANDINMYIHIRLQMKYFPTKCLISNLRGVCVGGVGGGNVGTLTKIFTL